MSQQLLKVVKTTPDYAAATAEGGLNYPGLYYSNCWGQVKPPLVVLQQLLRVG